MTVGVVLHLPESETSLRQWEYVLCHFGPDVIYLVASERPEGIVYATAVLIDDAEDLPTGPAVVLLAPITGRIVQGNEDLATFDHPADAIYWYGPDITEHMDPALYFPGGRQPDHLVFVPVDTDDQMFAHVAHAVVAWDRRAKGV